MIPRLPKGFSHPIAIGEGSFSSVYRVRQKSLDRWVAIKVLQERNSERRVKLLNEARNQARMSIASIPAVYDAFARGQRVFIVMEWVKGVSLQAMLDKGIPRSEDRMALAGDLVAALAGLHRLGYAHRDLKPANILISPEAGIYLVDFGFAKKVGEGLQSMVGTVKGTPAYMAPEIWRGGAEVDFIKADLFALGKVLQELDPGPGCGPLIDSLLAQDPTARPESAISLWQAWQAAGFGTADSHWKATAGQVTSELLSKRLLQSAQQLLFAGREEEAYWILVECLQEDPDAAEALTLMSRFPALSRTRTRNRWAGAALAAMVLFAAAMMSAYFFGKRSERRILHPAAESNDHARALLLSRRALGGSSPGIAGIPAKFREFSPRRGTLTGILYLYARPGCDSLDLDGSGVDTMSATAGLTTSFGEHTVVCFDKHGVQLSQERVSLLPFQRKIIRAGRAAAKRGSAT